jgi:Asp-tRNA(Asn)/Glu-tRNA(Gln) amidotransferase A subunit family amidase
MRNSALLPDRLTDLIKQLQTGKMNDEESIQQQIHQLHLDQSFHSIISRFVPSPNLQGVYKGIGLLHKDIFATPNRIAGFGNSAGKYDAQSHNAQVITQLEKAGIEHLGALTMAPYACGATGQNINFPRCINPLDANLAVGGSSSGSAIAVAAKMTYLSLGTDTSGSVRIPAATCGITGLKTTRGLISLEGVCPLSKTLDTVGLLGRYATDIAVILDIVSQPTLENFSQNDAIAYWLPSDAVTLDVKRVIEKFLNTFEIHKSIHIEEFADLKNATDIVMTYEICAQYQNIIHSDDCPMGLKAVGKKGKHVRQEQYQEVMAGQDLRIAHFVSRYFDSADLIVLPCIGTSIPLWTEVEVGNAQFSKEKYLSLFQFMGFINLLGLPSISIPIGEDSLGRPVSIQVIAKPFHEKRLLDFANTVEQRLFSGKCYLSQK